MSRFVITRAGKREYFFVLETLNGEVLLMGQVCESVELCENAACLAVENSRYDSRFIRKVSDDGEFYFTLEDKTHKIILGISEMYESEEGMDMGIELVKEAADVASIDLA